MSLVLVDVTVLSRAGEPIPDLGMADFTVLVDGKPRHLASHRLVSAGQAAPPAAAPSPSTSVPAREPSRRFILVVDRDHIPAGEGQPMLEAGARFIDGLPPGDAIALWSLSEPSRTVRFEADRETARRKLRELVGTFRPSGRYVIARDEAIAIDEGNREMLAAVVQRECDKMPPGCPVEVQAEALDVARNARQRADLAFQGLEALVKALGSAPGSKHLVLITGGPVATRDAIGTIKMIADQAASARVTIHALQVADTLLNTTTLRAQPRQIDQTQSAAYALASATGGLVTTPASGEIAFRQLARELAIWYELAFEPQPADRDGKEHRIEVRVADRGWGVSVRARRSFRIDPTLLVAPSSPAPTLSAVASPTEPPPDEPSPGEPTEAAAPGPVDIPSLTTNLANYAERFQQEFSAVVAEERYVQVIHPWRGNPKGPEAEPSLEWQEGEGDQPAKKGGPVISRRQLLSDVLLVQLKDGQWLGYRDVAVVDGSPVRNRTDRVRDLFLGRTGNWEAQLRAIAEESARYNLGDLRRNMNVPTLTLGFMRRADQWRFKFKREKDETVHGRPTRVVRFKEDARPTLIGTGGGVDIPIEGRIWVDAATGHVLRTELRFDRGGERRVYSARIRSRAEHRASRAVADVGMVPGHRSDWANRPGQDGRAVRGDLRELPPVPGHDERRGPVTFTGALPADE